MRETHTCEHGNSKRHEHGSKQVRSLAPAELENSRIFSFALTSMIPAVVVVGTIFVILSVGIIVLLIVGDEIN